MLKVSFKEDKPIPSRVVERFNDKVTVVTLHGKIELPTWWWRLPFGLQQSLQKHNKNITTSIPLGDCIYITVKGKAKRDDEDADNPELAEGIAESRAMLKLYKMMEKATDKIATYYFKILYGDADIHNIFYNRNDDSIYAAHQKYQALLIKESHHLGKLLEDA